MVVVKNTKKNCSTARTALLPVSERSLATELVGIFISYFRVLTPESLCPTHSFNVSPHVGGVLFKYLEEDHERERCSQKRRLLIKWRERLPILLWQTITNLTEERSVNKAVGNVQYYFANVKEELKKGEFQFRNSNGSVVVQFFGMNEVMKMHLKTGEEISAH